MDSELIFVVDLNEIEQGSLLPISLDFTLNYGPRVLVKPARPLHLNTWVKIHSDDDNTLYYAKVVRQVSARDYIVKVKWDSCAPVLNDLYSARTEHVFDMDESPTQAPLNIAAG